MKKQLETYFITMLVYIYVILSPPFVFSAYIPFEVRVMLEVIPLLFLLMAIHNTQHNFLVYICIWSMLVLIMFLNSESALISVAYSYSKLIFLFSIIPIVCASSFVFHLIRKFWFWIWFFISSSVIMTFLVYQLDLVDFAHLDFSEISERAPYNYYNNLFLGNIIRHRVFDFSVPKISWYIFEPGLLAFFLGLNVLIADSVYRHSSHSREFKILNLLAGFATFSTTFFIFSALYLTIKLSSHGRLKKFAFFIAPIAVAILSWYIYLALMDPDIAKFTSFDERVSRLGVAHSILSNSSILGFLFGNGIGISTTVSDGGISSGVMSILVERGFLILIFLSFIFYKYTRHNKAVLLYILFYHLTFEFVWYPAFLVGVSIVYATTHRMSANLVNSAGKSVLKSSRYRGPAHAARPRRLQGAEQ